MTSNKMIGGRIIKVKYFGPTDYKGSRYKASHGIFNEKPISIYYHMDHSCDASENATMACKALIKRYPEEFDYKHGEEIITPTPKAMGYCFQSEEYIFLCNLDFK